MQYDGVLSTETTALYSEKNDWLQPPIPSHVQLLAVSISGQADYKAAKNSETSLCLLVVLNSVPKKGADNKWVAFLHPKSTNGVLIELCQEII
jgi:hypothetical protein